MARKIHSPRIRKRNIALYGYIMIILMTMLTVSSYTWFSLSTTPRVSDMYMFVNAETGLELSLTPDAAQWELQLDFRDMVDETSPLRPVTWSEEDQSFYIMNYGADGRQTVSMNPLTDEDNANKDSADGYYIKTTFYARSENAVTVSLSPAVEVYDGIEGSGTYLIGQYEWDSETLSHNNLGLGAEYAVRIGFRITPMDGLTPTEQSEFYIYEPNCSTDPEAPDGYVPTPSIDGEPTLVDEDRLILQSVSQWTEADPVQHGVVIKQLGEFMTDPTLFSLKAGEMVKIDLYIWLEGQDPDCTSLIHDAEIFANIQFSTGDENQSGLVPIED